MDWNRRAFLVLIAAFWSHILFAYPTPVDFSGSISRWNIDANTPTITWAIETDDPDSLVFFEYAVKESAKLWSSVATSYLKLDKSADPATAHITISFLNSIQGGDSSSGFAEFDEMESDGPRHCKINIAASADIDGGSIAKTTLHELGHCLGLGHSLVAESIMSYDLEKNSFALALDDESAIARLYPKSGEKPKLPPGCAIRRSQDLIQEYRWLTIILMLPWLCLVLQQLAYKAFRK